MAWTDDRVEVLKKLWMDGLSASQIAKQLGGVTRNAVIGKVHRLGLSGRATPSRPVRRKVATERKAKPRTTSAARTTAAPKPAAPPPPPPMEAKVLPNGEYATILTVTEHMCKWPIGDPSSPDFRFCGRKTEPSDPYCRAHASMAYQPQRSRKRATTNLGKPRATRSLN